MYISIKDYETLIEAEGLVAHESNCRGSDELADLSNRLSVIIRKMEGDIKRRRVEQKLRKGG